MVLEILGMLCINVWCRGLEDDVCGSASCGQGMALSVSSSISRIWFLCDCLISKLHVMCALL